MTDRLYPKLKVENVKKHFKKLQVYKCNFLSVIAQGILEHNEKWPPHNIKSRNRKLKIKSSAKDLLIFQGIIYCQLDTGSTYKSSYQQTTKFLMFLYRLKWNPFHDVFGTSVKYFAEILLFLVFWSCYCDGPLNFNHQKCINKSKTYGINMIFSFFIQYLIIP